MQLDIFNFDYAARSRRPDIYLFCRNLNRERKVLKITGFRPYFCRPPYTEAEVTTEKDIFGNPLYKQVVGMPRDVSGSGGTESYEANIPYGLRFMIDKELYCGIDTDGMVPLASLDILPKIMFMDIEVSSPSEIVPRPEEAEYPITTIQWGTNYDDNVVVNMVYHKPVRDAIVFPTERQLIWKFANDVKEVDPDIIWVWFGDLFDWPYYFKRARRCGVDVSIMSPVDWVTFRENPDNPRMRRYSFSIHGRALVDGAKWYRAKHKPEGLPETMDLKLVLKKHTGWIYEDYGDRIEMLTETDVDTLVEYCRNDVKALKLLDETDDITAYFDRARKKVGGIIERAAVSGHIVYTRMLRVAKKRGARLPTIRFGGSAKDLTGGQVLVPKVGLHEMVAMFDAKSMYPTFIMMFNMSPETKNLKGDIEVGNGVRFISVPLGLLSEAVKTEYDERERLREKKKLYEIESSGWKKAWAEEQAAKFVTNSYYGVCKYIDIDVANSITFLGRETVKYLAEYGNGIGCPVLYGDTDSVFLKVENLAQAKELEPLLNEAISEYLEEKFSKKLPSIQMDIKLERLLGRVFFSLTSKNKSEAKKRWAAWVLWEDGPKDYIKIVGYPAKRTDSAQITRRMQRTFFEILLRKGDVSGAIRYVKEIIDKFHDLPMEDIMIPHGFSRDISKYLNQTVWQKGVMYSQKVFGLKYRQDSKYGLMYVEKVTNGPPTDVVSWEVGVDIPEEVRKRIVVDYREMVVKTIRAKMESNVVALGYDWGTIETGTKQELFDRWLS